MSPTCTVCSHQSRAVIDGLLASGRSKLSVAQEFGLGRSAVARHAENHLEGNLTRALATAQDVLDAISTTAIVGRALQLAQRADHLLDRAEANLSDAVRGDKPRGIDPKDITAAAAAMREARSTVELLAKLAIAAGDIDGAGARVEDDDLDRKLEAYIDHQLHPEDEILEAEVVEDGLEWTDHYEGTDHGGFVPKA